MMSTDIAESLFKAFRTAEHGEQKAMSELEKFPHPTMVKDLRDREINYALLHYAAMWGWTDALEELVSRYSCDPSCVNSDGWTVLHYACLHDHAATVQYLTVNLCQDPLRRNNWGLAPFYYSKGQARNYLEILIGSAKRKGFMNVIDYLKQCRDEKYEASVAKAMEEGWGDLFQSNIVLHGPPGAGKTSVKRLIIGLPPLPKEKCNATDIIENAVRAVSTSQLKEFKIIENDELISMIADEVDKYHVQKENVHVDSQMLTASRSKPSQSTEQPLPLSTSPNLRSSKTAHPSWVSAKATSIQSIRDMLSKGSGSVKLFDSHWHHVVDSGGQPQFQDVLPLVYRSPSLCIVVVRLTDGIDTKPKVCFYEEGREVYTLPNHLAQSNRQCIIRMCQIAACQATSEGIAPYVMIVGTHKDVLGSNSKTKIEEWNKELACIKKEFGNVLICKSEKEIVFAVNTMSTGAERQTHTKELQDCIASVSKRHASSVEVPLRWLTYQLDLDKGDGVVRMNDCFKKGEAIGMGRSDIQDALKFFSRAALVLYIPEYVPDIILTKMDPFIGRLSRLVKASFITPKYYPPAESEKLRSKGLFHKSFLATVFWDIPNADLHEDEFLKLLEYLQIAVHVGEGKYFLPSALSLEPTPKQSTFPMHSVPLVFSWGERILPHGFFFTFVVQLLGSPNEEGGHKFELQTDVEQWREEIQVNVAEGIIPGAVKLTNKTRWIQVCSSSTAKHCPNIYKAVNTAIEKTVKRFEHTGIKSPTVTVLCPLCTTRDHYCLLSPDKKEFTCSANKSIIGTVTTDMMCWTQGSEFEDACATKQHKLQSIHHEKHMPISQLEPFVTAKDHQALQNLDLPPVDDSMLSANDLCAVCDSIGEVTDWFTLGLTLNLPSHRLEWIQRERGFNEKERQRNMISLWLNNGDASWRALVQGLTNQQVNKCQVAKRISEQHPLKN